MTSTNHNGVYIFGKEKECADKLPKANAIRIADAVKRTKKYIKNNKKEYKRLLCPECGSQLEVYYDGPRNGDSDGTLIRHCEKCLCDWENEWHEDGGESELKRKFWG